MAPLARSVVLPGLIALAAGGLLACRRAPRAPVVACAQPAHDFGALVQGDRPAHGFRIENHGTAPLHIARVERSYSCAGRATQTTIAPGAFSDIHVQCDTGDRPGGRLADVLSVETDDPRTPDLRLEVSASIEPLLAFDTTLVEVTVPFGGAVVREARLRGRLAAEARLTIDASDEEIQGAEILRGGVDRSGGVRLTFRGQRVGRHAGRVLISSGLAKPATLALPYLCVVPGNLEVTPSNPYFNVRGPGEEAVSIEVKSTRPDFRLRGARIDDGPFTARIEAGGGPTYVVRVAVRKVDIPEGTRGSVGRLTLISNDPAEPSKEVPLFALGVREH